MDVRCGWKGWRAGVVDVCGGGVVWREDSEAWTAEWVGWMTDVDKRWKENER